MGRLLVIGLLLIIVITSSCNSIHSYRREKKHFYFEEFYSASDSLLLSDFIIYGISEEPKFRLKIQLKDDSLINILKSSLIKLPLNFSQTEDNNNYDNLSFFSGEYLTYEDINKSLLFKTANSYSDKKIIFPILLKYYKQRTNFDPARTVYPRFYCHLTLAVLVVENCEVLYYKQVRHQEIVNAEHHQFEFEDYHVPIAQKHWDELVQEVMKEYIERLE